MEWDIQTQIIIVLYGMTGKVFTGVMGVAERSRYARTLLYRPL
jgi:hypothetical protein